MKENIRMRLSSESKKILDIQQTNFRQKHGVDVSYSSIINQAVRNQSKIRNKSYWIEIKDKEIHFEGLNVESEWDYQTSFMIEQDVLELLLEMQIYFKEVVFNAKRIHRAFCVRLCLKAEYLSNIE